MLFWMIAKKRMVCNWRRIRQSLGAHGPLPPLSVGTNKTFHSCHLRERGEWMAAVVMEEIMEACMKTKIWILFCKHLIKSESSQSTIIISLVLRLMPIESIWQKDHRPNKTPLENNSPWESPENPSGKKYQRPKSITLQSESSLIRP